MTPSADAQRSRDVTEVSRFVYILMCHEDPEAIERLVRRVVFLSPTADVIVRCAIPTVIDADRVQRAGGRLFESRQHVVWGNWTLTEAVLEVLEHAVRTSDADHIVLVSGQDYPIRALQAWEAQVRSSAADALVDAFPAMPEDHRFRWSHFAIPGSRPQAAA